MEGSEEQSHKEEETSYPLPEGGEMLIIKKVIHSKEVIKEANHIK